MMNENYMDYIMGIHMIFEKRFTEVYRQSNAKRRAKLLPYIATIYRRWYYASLVEDTLLTPANLIESINRAFDQTPEAAPSVQLRSEGRFSGLRVDIINYTLAHHPVAEDLRRLIAFCGPDVELDENDDLTDRDAFTLATQLSLHDPHYAVYLLNIARIMRLLTKIPSIYANRAQVDRDAAERLAVSDEALLGEIVEATITLSAETLNQMIMLPQPVFTESFIRTLLKKPMETDDIFQRVYDLMGVTLEDLFDQDFEDDFEEFNETLLSGTFMMGVILDKYFYTPFSHYLRLIRPMYALPFDFDSDIKYYLDSAFDVGDLDTAFFAPCSRYHFTALGLAYFNIKPDASNYLDIQIKLPFEALRAQLFKRQAMMDGAADSPDPTDSADLSGFGSVYTFKIKSEQNPSQWLHLDMPADATLHRLYLEMVMRFGLERNNDYSFFHDETENPFAEYPSPAIRRRVKKTAEVTLDALDFDHQKKMILMLYDQRPYGKNASVCLTMELLNVKPREPGRVYPAVVRRSKSVREIHETEE